MEEVKQEQPLLEQLRRAEEADAQQQAAPAEAASAQQAAAEPSYNQLDDLLNRLKKSPQPDTGAADSGGAGSDTDLPEGIEVPSAAEWLDGTSVSDGSSSSTSAAAATSTAAASASGPAELVEADAILEQVFEDLPGGALPRGSRPEPQPLSRCACLGWAACWLGLARPLGLGYCWCWNARPACPSNQSPRSATVPPHSLP